MIIEESVHLMLCEPFFFLVQLFLCGTHRIYFYLHPTFLSSTEQCAWAIISLKEFKSWVTCISFAFAVWENRIICCQIFCDLLLKSAFEQIFNIMQLILVKIKCHIKWKYWIQKFHDIVIVISTCYKIKRLWRKCICFFHWNLHVIRGKNSL